MILISLLCTTSISIPSTPQQLMLRLAVNRPYQDRYCGPPLKHVVVLLWVNLAITYGAQTDFLYYFIFLIRKKVSMQISWVMAITSY